jgi:uncharacterized Zn finger protein
MGVQFSFAGINDVGKLIQIFRPVDGTEAHLAGLLPADQTLVAVLTDPDFAGARPGTCWHLNDTTDEFDADEEHCDEVEAKEKKDALIPLYQQRDAIVATAAATPSLDFTDELAAVDAAIAAVGA